MHEVLDAVALASPPWEALISQLAEPTPAFWREHATKPHQADLISLPQLVLANGSDNRVTSKRSAIAFQRWRSSAESQQIDIIGIRALAKALGEVGDTPIKLRSGNQGVTVAFYVAPKAMHFPKLHYSANKAIAGHPPLLRSLLCGLIMFAVHPFTDGNGRGARMHWVKGLHDAGYSAAEIADALGAFYGDSRIASVVAINCANSGGTALPFIKRWHQILSTLRPSKV